MTFGVVCAAIKPVVLRKLGIDFRRFWVLGNQLSVFPPLGLKLHKELANAMILFLIPVAHEPEIDREHTCGSQQSILWKKYLGHAVEGVDDSSAGQFELGGRFLLHLSTEIIQILFLRFTQFAVEFEKKNLGRSIQVLAAFCGESDIHCNEFVLGDLPADLGGGPSHRISDFCARKRFTSV